MGVILLSVTKCHANFPNLLNTIYYYNDISLTTKVTASDVFVFIIRNQFGPRYKGQQIFMVETMPHPNRPLVRPHDDHHFFCGRACKDEKFKFERRGHRMHTVLTQFETRKLIFAVGLGRPVLSSPDELPSAR